MNWILILIGVIGLSYLLSHLLDSQKQKESLRKIRKVPREIETKKEIIPQEFIYISELKDLINRYNLQENDINSFFEIVNNIITEGKKFAISELAKIIESDDLDESKASKLINKANELKKGTFKMEIRWSAIDKTSIKIFPETLDQWAIEFNIYDDIKSKPRSTMKKILEEKLFQYGIETLIKKIRVELEFLEKNLKEGNIDRVKDLISEIESNIKK